VRQNIVQNAKNNGDIAPDFLLTNAAGKEVKLSDYLKIGAVVLTWYRGGWCPYCNMTLQYLQQKLPDIQLYDCPLLVPMLKRSYI
jgi:peroxiredoxin